MLPLDTVTILNKLNHVKARDSACAFLARGYIAASAAGARTLLATQNFDDTCSLQLPWFAHAILADRLVASRIGTGCC